MIFSAQASLPGVENIMAVNESLVEVDRVRDGDDRFFLRSPDQKLKEQPFVPFAIQKGHVSVKNHSVQDFKPRRTPPVQAKKNLFLKKTAGSFGDAAERVLVMPKPVKRVVQQPPLVLAKSLPQPDLPSGSIFPPRQQISTRKRKESLLFVKEPVRARASLFCECNGSDSEDTDPWASSPTSSTSRSSNSGSECPPQHRSVRPRASTHPPSIKFKSSLTQSIRSHNSPNGSYNEKCNDNQTTCCYCGLDLFQQKPRADSSRGDLPATSSKMNDNDDLSFHDVNNNYQTPSKDIATYFESYNSSHINNEDYSKLQDGYEFYKHEESENVDPHSYLKTYEDICEATQRMGHKLYGVPLTSKSLFKRRYLSCFSGTACVKWLVKNLKDWALTESTAAKLAESMIELDLVHRTGNEKNIFVNSDSAYYEFTPEPRRLILNTLNPTKKNTEPMTTQKSEKSNIIQQKNERSKPRACSASPHRSLPNETKIAMGPEKNDSISKDMILQFPKSPIERPKNPTPYSSAAGNRQRKNNQKSNARGEWFAGNPENAEILAQKALSKIQHLFYEIGDCDPSKIPEINPVEYKIFLDLVNELSSPSINILTLSYDQQTAFWINVHNCLFMHALVVFGPGQNDRTQFYRRISYYIEGQVFSLLDIKYGILRASLPLPRQSLQQTEFLFPPMLNNKNDLRQAYKLSRYADNRMMFALCEESYTSPRCLLYSGAMLETQLLYQVRCYIDEHVETKVTVGLRGTPSRFQDGGTNMAVGTTQRHKLSIVLPHLFAVYRDDFGVSNYELLQYVASHCELLSASIISDFVASYEYDLTFKERDCRYNYVVFSPNYRR